MPKRKLPPNNEVIEMYESGMSCGEIAEKCGVAYGTVYSLLKRIGHKMREIKEATALKHQRGRFKVTKYWTGKKQPPEMVEKRVSKIRGENHYLWKGGESRRPYRDIIEKVKCAKCKGKLNLGIHHIDLDHYNDDPNNLEVLCVSCHITLHKKLYWVAKRNGTEYKTNSPIGWER